MGTSFCSTCATSTPGEFAGAPVGVAFEQPAARSKAVAVRQSVARTTNLCFNRVVTFTSDNCEAAREWRLEATAHSTLSTTVKVRGAAEGEKLPRQTELRSAAIGRARLDQEDASSPANGPHGPTWHPHGKE